MLESEGVLGNEIVMRELRQFGKTSRTRQEEQPSHGGTGCCLRIETNPVSLAKSEKSAPRRVI